MRECGRVVGGSARGNRVSILSKIFDTSLMTATFLIETKSFYILDLVNENTELASIRVPSC